MICIVDTFAWVEYFIGSSKGAILKKNLSEKNNRHITMECCLTELVGYCKKNNKDYRPIIGIVKANSVLLPVTQELWIKAAQIRFRLRKKVKNFGLVDAIIAAKQEDLKCKIITGDPHFKTLKNVIYLGN